MNGSEDCKSMAKLTSEQHEGIWKALDELAREHRASPDAKWVMPLDAIVAIEELAKRFEPKDALQRLRYLFDEQMPRLSDFGRHDFTEYDKVLAARRLEALQTILDAQGMAALLELRDSAKQPFAVGWTVGESGIEAGEVDILLDLGSDDLQRRNYAAGYVAGRYRKEGLAWVDDALRKLDGRAVEQGRLLQMVREFPDVWERAKSLGPEVEAAYWKEFVPGGHGSDFDLVNHAADKLIEFGRPAAAADFLALYSNNAQPERIAATMEAVLAAPAEEQQRLSPYDLQRLLEALRNANFDENRLAILEWRSFPGLGFDVPAPTLERLLARDPGFFVQTLSLCFKRADGAEEARPSPETARNAFHVLHEWQVVPGSAERNGEVDDVRLKAWLDGAFDLLAKNDRVAIGSQYIGHSFANAREDPDGTWPTRPIRDAIERLASEQVERGFANQIFNNRGVTTRGLTDGGRQERALAEKFDAWAVKIRDTWPRTAAVLRSVAESYRAQGQAEDEEAERFKQGLSPF
jgi:hypothetical protein